MTKQVVYILFLLLINQLVCLKLRTGTKTGVSKIALKKVAPIHLHTINFVSEMQESINDYSECNL